MSMVKYSEAIKKGLVFGASPVRWLPVFIVDIVFFSLVVGFVVSNPDLMVSFLTAVVNPASVTEFSSLGAVGVLGGAWFLARLWVTGAVIHQAFQEKEFDKSWALASGQYPRLLGAALVTVAAAFLAGLVPFIGQLIVVLVSLLLFFSLQSVVGGKSSPLRAVRDSWAIFRKNLSPLRRDRRLGGWAVVVLALIGISFFLYSLLASFGSGGLLPGLVGVVVVISGLAFLLFYSTVFRLWAVIAIFSGAIILLFAVPALMVAAFSVPPDLLLLGESAFQAILLHLLSNPALLFGGGAIFLVGSSIATAFALKAQTEFYLQLKKKFLGIF